MNFRMLLISMLGMAGVVIPARATMSFYTGPAASSQYSDGVSLAGLIVTGPLTFDPSDLLAGSHEYSDPSGVNFFALSNSGGSPGSPTTFTVSGSNRLVGQTGMFLEVTLPANVYSFAMNVTVPSSFGIFCGSAEAPDTGCDHQFVVSGTSDIEFFGVISTTPISSVWIYAQIGGPSIVNFQEGSTPEPRSLMLLGSGLILLGFFKRRLRRPRAVPSGQY